MTKSEATATQRGWTEHGNLPPCQHLTVELERTEGGAVCGTYRCTTCGAAVPR